MILTVETKLGPEEITVIFLTVSEAVRFALSESRNDFEMESW